MTDDARPTTIPSAIVFDWDNTLIDSWPAIHDAQNHTLAHFGLPTWSMDEIKTRVRKSMRDSYPELFGDRWLEAGDVFYARFESRHLDTLTPLPGAGEMLSALAEAEIYLSVVSNKKGDYLRREAEQLGWDRHFGRMVGAFDASKDKPDREPVDMALEPGGISPGPDVWFVGDADIDLECAGNAGCQPVLLRKEEPKTGEFANHPPKWHFRDCHELANLVQSIKDEGPSAG